MLRTAPFRILLHVTVCVNDVLDRDHIEFERKIDSHQGWLFNGELWGVHGNSQRQSDPIVAGADVKRNQLAS